MTVLVIDNYDSFTYNLVQYLGELGARTVVARNDALTVAQVAAMGADRIVVSPGPRTPDDAGVSLGVIAAMAGRVPILGVCLGHQAIAQCFGGRIVRARDVVHGKTSSIVHDARTIFSGLPNPFVATRYHSLVVEPTSVPDVLEVSARTPEGDIMGLRHRHYPVEGVQFHPESILTVAGKALLANFLGL